MNKHLEWWNKLPNWKKLKLAEDEYWIDYKDMDDWQIKNVYLKTDNY